MKSDGKAKVNLKIEKFDARTGKKIGEIKTHNKVVDAGLNLIRSFMAGNSPTEPTHLAIGTGTTAPTKEDTALETEVFRDTFTQTQEPETGKVTYKYYLASGDANSNNISEAGLLNADSGGTLYARATFEADEKTDAEAWTFTWDCTWADA